MGKRKKRKEMEAIAKKERGEPLSSEEELFVNTLDPQQRERAKLVCFEGNLLFSLTISLTYLQKETTATRLSAARNPQVEQVMPNLTQQSHQGKTECQEAPLPAFKTARLRDRQSVWDPETE